MPLSKHQQQVLDRILRGDRLTRPVTWSSSGRRLGVGVWHFPDGTPVSVTTWLCLCDAGRVQTINYGGYDRLEISG